MQGLLFLLIAVLGVHSFPSTTTKEKDTCGYDSCPKTQPGVINVHIVAHTHDDVGWLKTVDQYYYGSRNNIQKAGVQYILDSVIKELWDDPARRFIYVETAFFWKWWIRQDADVQHKVHTLVNQGRLQFVGGAWSMNDEAAAHYQSTIDQFTWGLSKLNKTFGHCGLPRVGWQIDPFGHSREFASLLSMMGYDGLFLGRIDYQDKANRLRTKTMETIWRGDDHLGKSSDIFTGVLHNTYSPPPGFCFDVLCNDEPIVDDPNSPMYNVPQKIELFLDYVKQQSLYYRSNNVIVTMGGDFTYQDAYMWYNNLDKLIKYGNLVAAKNQLPFKLYYSTPNCYLKAVRDANPSLPTKQDDFFPYASDPNAYWTGYFTSRPTTKYFERESNNYLQMVKQLQVLTRLDEHNQFVLDELKSAMGVMQHHDAITGTEKQHVAHDYERLLNQAVDDAMIIAKEAFNKASQKDDTKPLWLDFQRCHLNESKCYVSETSTKFVVTIYNPLGWTVQEPIRIPVPDYSYTVFGPDGEEIKTQSVEISNSISTIPTRTSKATKELVFVATLKPLSYQSLYIKRNKRVRRHNNNFEYLIDSGDIEMIREKDEGISREDRKDQNDEKDQRIPFAPVFMPKSEFQEADIGILKDGTNNAEFADFEKFFQGTKVKDTYRQNRERMGVPKLSDDEMRMLSDDPRVVERFDDFVDLENEFFKVTVDKALGITKDVFLADGTKYETDINMYYYPAMRGENSIYSDRASGAYIFRPNATTPTKLNSIKTEVIKGDIVSEFRVTLHPSGFLNTKVYKNLNFIENEFVVGPIPIEDEIGKEYIVRYKSDIANNGEFYTDSNGRQVIKRNINHRPQYNLTIREPVAGNYYPITNEIHIKNNDVKMTVLTDRSVGGSSLDTGEIEVMIHRRLLWDDAFGVGEALNETAEGLGLVVRGKHRLIFTNFDANTRKSVLEVHQPPILLFSDATNLKFDEWVKLNNEFSFLVEDLPKGLHLLTLEPWEDKILIRIENYLEDSSIVELDLAAVFKNIKISNIKETTLGANVWVNDYKKWYWNNEGSEESGDYLENVGDGVNIKLKSKEIKTYIADYE